MANPRSEKPKLKRPFTVAAVNAWKHPGNFADGGGLYLQVATSAAGNITKSWTFRYRDRATGKLKEVGMGPLADRTLGEARDKAAEFRKLLLNGMDPKAEKVAKLTAAKVEAAKVMTFDQAAAKLIADKAAGWKNAKHGEQWTNTLATYASPVLGSLPVASIDLPLVRKVLDPIWTTKNETASRVRQRIEAVLGWATVSGYRTGDNPARWKNHLDHLLAKPSKVQKEEHHPALPYLEAGAFVAELRGQKGVAARALEFLILTAARTGEVIEAKWEEFSEDRKTWTIPAERMKAEKEHIVPLSHRAAEIIKEMSKAQLGAYVFPSAKPDEPLSTAAMAAVMKRMDARKIEAEGTGWRDADGRAAVPHGFRSTFRDWAGEMTNFPREIIEAALAHQLKDKAEAAYARGTMPERRRKLMDAWAQYCATAKAAPAEIIPIRSAR